MVTAHGVGALQEGGLMPVLDEKAYDLGPVLPPVLHEDGVIGSLLHAFVGLHQAPSILELSVQLTYLALVGGTVWRIYGIPVGAPRAMTSKNYIRQ